MVKNTPKTEKIKDRRLKNKPEWLENMGNPLEIRFRLALLTSDLGNVCF